MKNTHELDAAIVLICTVANSIRYDMGSTQEQLKRLDKALKILENYVDNNQKDDILCMGD